MKKIALIVAAAGVVGFAGTALAQGKQPDDAIKQNIDKNGAFSFCNSSAITNGIVVFGGNSAINTPGQGGLHAAEGSAVGTQGSTSEPCGLTSDSQRVEPRAFWPN